MVWFRLGRGCDINVFAWLGKAPSTKWMSQGGSGVARLGLLNPLCAVLCAHKLRCADQRPELYRGLLRVTIHRGLWWHH